MIAEEATIIAKKLNVSCLEKITKRQSPNKIFLVSEVLFILIFFYSAINSTIFSETLSKYFRRVTRVELHICEAIFFEPTLGKLFSVPKNQMIFHMYRLLSHYVPAYTEI